MNYAFLILGLFLIFIVIVPLTALPDSFEVSNQRPVSCGMKCVIMTKGFTTQEEAIFFATPLRGKVYQIDRKDLWFVDYQVTEMEANLLD